MMKAQVEDLQQILMQQKDSIDSSS